MQHVYNFLLLFLFRYGIIFDMLSYLLGIVTGILISILNISLYALFQKKEVFTFAKQLFKNKATIVDMTPDIDLGNE